MFYPRPGHLHRGANTRALATSQGDTSSPHSHGHPAHGQPTLSHHISAGITDSPIIFLSRPDPNTEQGHLQDTHHCLLIGFGSLKSKQEKKVRNFPSLTPSLQPTWWLGGRPGRVPLTPGKMMAAKSHVSQLSPLGSIAQAAANHSLTVYPLFSESKTWKVVAGEGGTRSCSN